MDAFLALNVSALADCSAQRTSCNYHTKTPLEAQRKLLQQLAPLYRFPGQHRAAGFHRFPLFCYEQARCEKKKSALRHKVTIQTPFAPPTEADAASTNISSWWLHSIASTSCIEHWYLLWRFVQSPSRQLENRFKK